MLLSFINCKNCILIKLFNILKGRQKGLKTMPMTHTLVISTTYFENHLLVLNRKNKLDEI